MLSNINKNFPISSGRPATANEPTIDFNAILSILFLLQPSLTSKILKPIKNKTETIQQDRNNTIFAKPIIYLYPKQ